ncbi:MAG: hypothetical protein BGN96_08970 [Bacteroidales bacterium 45-6]|nr:MAG: hypothetical protein BGN96_08970 [Bacteroidales bacterium 45-6]
MEVEKSRDRDFSFKEKFFEKFFRENYSRFYYYALHFISDPEICKDIVSDAFRHLWEKDGEIIPETLHAYMFNRIRNACIDNIRHTQVEDSYIREHQRLASEMDDESWMESEKRIKRIMEIIEGLPALTRMIMEQNYLHQKKYKEMADMFEMSESGIRKHVMKGLEIIRKEFSVNYKKGSN